MPHVLSAFTSAWADMNMHDGGELGIIHQQSVQHATVGRPAGAGDLQSGTLLTILSRSASAKIRSFSTKADTFTSFM